jgi:hypothetical protein
MTWSIHIISGIMNIVKIIKIEGFLSLIGSIALFAWWFAMPLFLPLADAEENFQNLVLDPQWITLNLIGLMAVIFLVLGFPGFYLKSFEKSRSPGFIGLIVTCSGLILYACIQYYETLLWPAAARVYPELLETGGILLSGDPGIVTGLIASGVLLSAGYILFGISALRSRVYPRLAVWFLMFGAPLFGMGILFPLRTVGLILFCAGTIWLALELRKV